MSDIVEIDNKQVIEALYLYKKLSGDLKPIFTKFETYYQKFIGEKWELKGAPFGKKWKGLTPQYKTWKRKQIGKASANLILTGRLKRAATGGSEWISKKTGSTFEFGVKVPYADAHQRGDPSKKLPQRPFFLMKNNKDLPLRAVGFLLNSIAEDYEKIKDKI